MKPSMWCTECEVWTKSYGEKGLHNCGTEVLSEGKGNPDLNYEGTNEQVYYGRSPKTYQQ